MFNLLHHGPAGIGMLYAKLDAYASKSRSSYRTNRGRAIMLFGAKAKPRNGEKVRVTAGVFLG